MTMDIYTLADAIAQAAEDERDRLSPETFDRCVDSAAHAVMSIFTNADKNPERERVAKVAIRGGSGPERCATVRLYLPDNYRTLGFDDEFVYIAGVDKAGWTLHGYVIPRLASGLYEAEEITEG